MVENNKTPSCSAVSLIVEQMKRNIAYILDIYHKYKNIFILNLFGNKCNTCDEPIQNEQDDYKVS